MRFAAAILCVAMAGCAGTGDGDGAMSVEETRNKSFSEIVRVQGPVVIQYGAAMICTELTSSEPPQCDAGLWLRGPNRQLAEQELKTDGSVRWAESVTLEGTVDGDGFFTLAP